MIMNVAAVVIQHITSVRFRLGHIGYSRGILSHARAPMQKVGPRRVAQADGPI